MDDRKFPANASDFCRSILRTIIGEISWKSPAWMNLAGAATRHRANAVQAWAKADVRRATLWGLLVLTLIFGSVAGKIWYDRQPKPLLATWQISELKPTPIDDPDAKPDPLLIKFSQSVAKLGGVGKEVTAGITVEPRIDGAGKWEDDHTLSFKPKADWPVGTPFKVSLQEKGFLAEQVRLKDYQIKFVTPPFVAKIAEAEFYQDPVDPATKKIVATVSFSHPVDAADFERRIVLREQGVDAGLFASGAGNKKFKVTYDKFIE